MFVNRGKNCANNCHGENKKSKRPKLLVPRLDLSTRADTRAKNSDRNSGHVWHTNKGFRQTTKQWFFPFEHIVFFRYIVTSKKSSIGLFSTHSTDGSFVNLTRTCSFFHLLNCYNCSWYVFVRMLTSVQARHRGRKLSINRVQKNRSDPNKRKTIDHRIEQTKQFVRYR